MFLGGGLLSGSVTAAVVQTPAIDLSNQGTNTTVYSGIRWDSDGDIYKLSTSGAWNSAATWLLSGAASSYYLFRTVDSGTLDVDDGDGNQLNTGDLDYSIANSVAWFTKTAQVTFSIADDTAGSNVLASRQYSLVAYRIGSGDPP